MLLGSVALGFLALSLALNAALIPHLTDALPGNAGDPMLNAWILGWVSDAIVAHPWDLWDAPIFHPHLNTLAYSEHLLGIAVFVAPVYWLTGNAVLTYNVAFLAGYAFAGFAMFVLVRRLTGRTDAALVAGVLFACSPYLTSSQIARVQMLTSGWSALALAALHRFIDSGERRALGGFVASWMLQTLSNMYLGVFLALPIGLVVAHALVVRRPRLALGRVAADRSRRAGAGDSARARAGRLRPGAGRMGFAHGRDTVRRYSADVLSYVSVWIDRQPLLLWPEISADRALYPGAAIVLLAVWGFWMAARRRLDGPVRSSAALYGAVALAAFALSLGPSRRRLGMPIGIGSPYAALLDLVPGFDGFRAPARFALPGADGPGRAGGHRRGGTLRPGPAWRARADRRRGRGGAVGGPAPLPVDRAGARRGAVDDGRLRLARRPTGRPGAGAADHHPLPGAAPGCRRVGDAALSAGGAPSRQAAHQRQLGIRLAAGHAASKARPRR